VEISWLGVGFSWLVVTVSVVISPERGEFSFIGSGVVEQTGWGVETKSQEIEVKIEPSPHSMSTEKKVLETCSPSLPHPYVLATLAHYEGCNIPILLWSWFKASSLMGMSL
jgi:hypothetical protein